MSLSILLDYDAFNKAAFEVKYHSPQNIHYACFELNLSFILYYNFAVNSSTYHLLWQRPHPKVANRKHLDSP